MTSPEQDLPWQCQWCGEQNEVLVDSAAGTAALKQQFTEDCRVCCRPNVLIIVLDAETLEVVELRVEREE